MSTPSPDLPPFEDGPNIALIPLPTGLTPEQFFALQSSLVSISITAAIAFGIVVWDYFYLLPDEYNFYQKAKKAEWRTLVPWSFMVLRCSGIMSILATLCISSFQSDHCEVGLAIAQWAAVVVTATSGIAFGYRVMSLWRTQRIVVATIVALMFIIMIGAWVAVASQYRARTGPSTPFASNCEILPFVPWAPASHASSALFNVTMLIFVVLKFVDQRAQKSVSGFLAYRESLTHIVLATGASVTALILQLLAPEYQLVKRIVLPYATLITATMGARVFLALRVAAVRAYPPSSAVTPSQGNAGGMEFRLTATTGPRKTGKGADKVAYVMGAATPVVMSKPALIAENSDSFISDVKTPSNPYTSFPSPPYPFSTPSPSSTFNSSSLPSSKSPRSLPLPPHDSPYTPPANFSIDAGGRSPAAPLAPGPYTTFPPPSPLPSVIPRSSSSLDSSTPFLKSKFSMPSLAGAKKGKKDREYQSGWV